MKKATIVCLIILCGGAFAFQSSSTTKFQKKTGFQFIPTGEIVLKDQTKSIAAFMMLNHEVTNAEYRLFVKEAYADKGDIIGLKTMLPDTNSWLDSNNLNGFMDPFAKLYYSHPAYDSYPVVNVSIENAQQYCKWLGEKIAVSFPELEFIKMRLPTQEEWVYAAKGGLKLSQYPWGGASTRNSKGDFRANFYSVGEHNITRDENGKPIIVNKDQYLVDVDHTMTQHFALAIAKSYSPNGYGLYNMAGNAAEMVVSDKSVAMGGHWMSFGNDIQVTSEITFDKPNPFVGFRPVYSYLNKLKN